MDLLVAVGGPAMRFALDQREQVFPSTPLLAIGLDRRVADVSTEGNAIVVPFALDLRGAVENIFHVLPDTEHIVVVLGSSPLSRVWLEETQREFSRFFDRARFTWTNEWSLEEMEKRLATLPPRSAIFFGELGVDGAGVPHTGYNALERLHAVANAPIFSLFETQIGRGIVGGLLISEAEVGRRAASAAVRILNGEAPERIETPPVAGRPVYDFRELERWGIGEARLPAGSRILFRPPSVWDQYRGPLLIGLSVMGLQAVLIGGLLVQRSRRRVAEEEARGLARRLLTAHEDEHRRLARELHDDFSQRLARLAIDATVVERSLSASPEQGSARAMRDDLIRLSEDVHALSYQLHPSVLDDLGLKDALAVECARFSRRESIAAELTTFEVPRELPPDVSTCLFRVAQEALRNAARHSRASTVSLAVAPVNGAVQMTVADNGVGFDPTRRRTHRSLGHASMRERASLVQGTLEVESKPGRGTTVRVSVPLKERSA
jgi:signal transduction histidine kinase